MPTGSHGAFRDYQIDAITLEISPKISLKNEIAHSTFLLRGGRSVIYNFRDNLSLAKHAIIYRCGLLIYFWSLVHYL